MPKTNHLTSRYTQDKAAAVVQHKRRTEAEMRKALAIIDSKKDLLRVHADDEHDVVLQDCVEELLQARQTIEDVRAFIQTWTAKNSAKSLI